MSISLLLYCVIGIGGFMLLFGLLGVISNQAISRKGVKTHAKVVDFFYEEVKSKMVQTVKVHPVLEYMIDGKIYQNNCRSITYVMVDRLLLPASGKVDPSRYEEHLNTFEEICYMKKNPDICIAASGKSAKDSVKVVLLGIALIAAGVLAKMYLY